jgi:hypothetical protein
MRSTQREPIDRERPSPKPAIKGKLEYKDGIWYSGRSGFWSFFDENTARRLLEEAKASGCLGAVRSIFPEREDIIFSPKRAGGIGMLDFKQGDTVVDVGCMWGALTIPAAKAAGRVIAIDKTAQSLAFLKERLREEELSNVELICADINNTDYIEGSVDKFIVNGVLEWVPEPADVSVTDYYMKKRRKGIPLAGMMSRPKGLISPRQMQKGFLKKLCQGLKKNGMLYLGIENRFDAAFFLGARDPHTGLRFVNILPRALQEFYSLIVRAEPYRTWIYSQKGIRRLLRESGFIDIEIYYAFPDYRIPELILSEKGYANFKPVRYLRKSSFIKKVFWYALEYICYQLLRLKSLSPSFIIIARKG